MEHEGKSLPTVLAELDDNTLVYLGSASSFFDIAAAGELRKKKYMDDLSKRLEADGKDQADSMRKNFARLLKKPPVWEGPREGESEAYSIEKHLEAVSRWARKVKEAPQRIQDAERRVREFVPLKKRAVKDIYPRIDGTGVCVIVSGEEMGGYWFLDEKRSGNASTSKRDDEAGSA